MPASTAMITDITSVITNGPAAVTLANCIAAAGPIMDYRAQTNSTLLRFDRLVTLLNQIKTDTASGDTANLALINKALAALQGTSTPSTTIITDMRSVYTTGPGATTIANSIAAAGPIMDYLGNVNITILALIEAKVILTALLSVTDSGTDSTNRTLISNLLITLS